MIGMMATVQHWRGSINGMRATAVALLGSALLLSACAPALQTHGYRADAEALAQIQPGQTSREQVLQLLGSPSALSAFDGQAWYYITQRTEQRSFYQQNVVGQDVVAIAFDEQGMVAAVDRRGLDDARQVALVERETPTVGNELGILEQFVGNIGRFNLPRDERDRMPNR